LFYWCLIQATFLLELDRLLTCFLAWVRLCVLLPNNVLNSELDSVPDLRRALLFALLELADFLFAFSPPNSSLKNEAVEVVFLRAFEPALLVRALLAVERPL